MPVNGTGQGQSANTPIKQENLLYFFHVHAGIVRGIHQKYPRWADPSYLYIDTNSGTGTDDDGHRGSVLIAQHVFGDMFAHTLRGIAMEIKPGAFAVLQKTLTPYPSWRLLQGDNAALLSPSLLPLTRRSQYGLVYTDPNRPKELPLAALEAFFRAQQAHRIDILIHMSANVIKRINGAGFETYTLPDIITRLNKHYWYVRQGYHRDQWTFLYGTNWDKWPPLNLRVDTLRLKIGSQDLKSLGMYNITSAVGETIWQDLITTNAEKQKKTLTLFPIARIVNT